MDRALRQLLQIEDNARGHCIVLTHSCLL